MYRNLLICLLASIAVVFAQSSNHQPIDANVTSVFNETKTITTNGTTNSPPHSTSLATSTSAPTTSTTKPPTTTTAKPNSTTTVAPPNPPPVPKPETFKGNVTEGNKTCINVEFSVQITIKYNNTNNEEKTTGFTIPTNASVDLKSSHCSDDPKKPTPETITIRFDKEEHTSANMTLIFNTTGDGSVFVEEVELSFVATEDLMPGLETKLYGQTISAAKNELSLFKVASVHSYVCSAAQSAKLDSHEDRITGVQIEFTDSKVEAYINESNKGKFDSEIDCKSADISDVVPIAVGAALAGLVVIVLIAYFIGRRRSRRLAYQSV